MHNDICCIGHITNDHIITPQSDVHLSGGSCYYFTHGIHALCPKEHGIVFQAVTSLSATDTAPIEEIRNKGISIEVIPSKHTTCFKNIYSNNFNHRKQEVTDTADPFTWDNLKDLQSKYFVLGPLLANDFDLQTIKKLHKNSTLVLDAQGFIRKVNGVKVEHCDWAWKQEALPFIDILKVNEEEARALTGLQELKEAALQLATWGVKEVLLTLGSEGSIILAQGQFYRIFPCQPLSERDATGCGDTYVMGYIFKRALGAGYDEAGRFASAVSTIKLERHGPFNASYDEAIKRMLPQ